MLRLVLEKFYAKLGYLVGLTSRGQEFYFDKEDFDVIKDYTWFIDTVGYPSTKGKPKRLHRLLLNPPGKLEIDHIDRQKINNRRNNLRVCTISQNKANIALNKANTSGYKGVYFHKRNKVWMARITINRKMLYLGSFENKEEAALVYNKAASFYFDEFACLNVIESKPISLEQKEVLRV